MGTNNIPSAVDGTPIPETDHNAIQEALANDHVPRNTSGVPTDIQGGLGTSTFRWGISYIKKIFLGAVSSNLTMEEDAGDIIFRVAGIVILRIASGGITTTFTNGILPNLKSQIFTSGGTFTTSANVSRLFVVGAGGGGGGGGGAGGTSQTGGGGGAGGQPQTFAIDAAPSTNYTVTLGAGGASGSGGGSGASGVAGGNGVASTFGSIISFKGGEGGQGGINSGAGGVGGNVIFEPATMPAPGGAGNVDQNIGLAGKDTIYGIGGIGGGSGAGRGGGGGGGGAGWLNGGAGGGGGTGGVGAAGGGGGLSAGGGGGGGADVGGGGLLGGAGGAGGGGKIVVYWIEI